MQIWLDIQHTEPWVRAEDVERMVGAILRALDLSDAEVSVVLVDDEEIARLNRQYLNRTGPTNVIAFSMREGEGAHVTPQLLGDVVISLDTCRREAEDGSLSFEKRLLQLLAHGILHLLGHDHEGDENEAKEMEAEEAHLMAVVEREKGHAK